MRSRTIYWLLPLVALTGCTSSGRMTNGWGRAYEPSGSQAPASVSERPVTDEDTGTTTALSPDNLREDVIRMVRPADDVALELTLRSELDRWMGVPYVLGGTTMRGVDCSGLVQRVFSDALDVPTPRTTDGMLRTGRRVNATALRVGDLVFFEPGGNYTHVGIYLGEDEFAHASSSNGVMISNLNESYWRRTYTTSRRLLEPGAGTPRPAESVGTIRGVSSGPGW